jgi:NADPH2:quinone reductase
MRAWQVRAKGEAIEVLDRVTLDPPQPGPGQIRIGVTAAGIGLPDVLMCRHTYPLTPPVPFVPGQEVSGVVTAVGEGVDSALMGSRVMAVTSFQDGHGSFAEECLAPEASAFPVPEGLTHVEAAGFWIPHLTGWIGLVDRGRLAAGEWLAVLGAGGGSGIAAVQLGHALGARVIAIVGDEERATFCRSLGAEETLNHRDGPLAPALRQITAGGGVDVIYDPVGGPSAEDAAGALARFGRWLAVGERLADGSAGRREHPGRAGRDPCPVVGSHRRRPVAQRGDRTGSIRRSPRRTAADGRSARRRQDGHGAMTTIGEN